LYGIFPRVFFGGAGITRNPNVMLRTGITHVANCESYAARSVNFLFLNSYEEED
jgi:hypothetical protein